MVSKGLERLINMFRQQEKVAIKKRVEDGRAVFEQFAPRL